MYELVESFVSIENRTYATFGMSCKEMTIKDISTDRAEVLRLITECNNKNLDSIHLTEVIENFLTG